jgi:hypothetical protein
MPGTSTSRSGPARNTSATVKRPWLGSAFSLNLPSVMSLIASIDIFAVVAHTCCSRAASNASMTSIRARSAISPSSVARACASAARSNSILADRRSLRPVVSGGVTSFM